MALGCLRDTRDACLAACRDAIEASQRPLRSGRCAPRRSTAAFVGPGLTPVPPARGGYEPRRRETAPGSAFRHVSGRRPSMSRDDVTIVLDRTIVKQWSAANERHMQAR